MVGVDFCLFGCRKHDEPELVDCPLAQWVSRVGSRASLGLGAACLVAGPERLPVLGIVKCAGPLVPGFELALVVRDDGGSDRAVER